MKTPLGDPATLRYLGHLLLDCIIVIGAMFHCITDSGVIYNVGHTFFVLPKGSRFHLQLCGRGSLLARVCHSNDTCFLQMARVLQHQKRTSRAGFLALQKFRSSCRAVTLFVSRASWSG